MPRGVIGAAHEQILGHMHRIRLPSHHPYPATAHPLPSPRELQEVPIMIWQER